MVKKVYFEKHISEAGKVTYTPVAEYDSDFLDSFTKGNHLVLSYPGGTSRKFNIDPALAPMIAAGRYAEDAICKAISKASEMRPQRALITDGQRTAWKKLAEEFGDELATLDGLCIRDCADAGIEAMQEEAAKLMTNPSVKKAYDNFMLICQLSKEQGNE
jgi:hypothetical protein